MHGLLWPNFDLQISLILLTLTSRCRKKQHGPVTKLGCFNDVETINTSYLGIYYFHVLDLQFETH